jgi:hypothetical protein
MQLMWSRLSWQWQQRLRTGISWHFLFFVFNDCPMFVPYTLHVVSNFNSSNDGWFLVRFFAGWQVSLQWLVTSLTLFRWKLDSPLLRKVDAAHSMASLLDLALCHIVLGRTCNLWGSIIVVYFCNMLIDVGFQVKVTAVKSYPFHYFLCDVSGRLLAVCYCCLFSFVA